MYKIGLDMPKLCDIMKSVYNKGGINYEYV